MGLWFVRKTISPHVIPTGNNSGNGKNRWKRVEHCRAECSKIWLHRRQAPHDTSATAEIHLLVYHCTLEVFPSHHSKQLWRSRTVHKVHVGMHCEMWTAFSEQVFWFWAVITAPYVFPDANVMQKKGKNPILMYFFWPFFVILIILKGDV